MIKPRALEPGSRLAVVAPASSFPRQEFDDGIAELERLGSSDLRRSVLRVSPTWPGAYAAPMRSTAPSIRHAGIIAVRGGFGVHVLPLLDPAIVRRPGRSSATAHHLAAIVRDDAMRWWPSWAYRGGRCMGAAAYDPHRSSVFVCR